jgi:EAL domain-containing protein (putative c-di-GMP-specific phosphodiesterase class I)
VSVAIDDFGTGHFSLSRLRQLPVDILKIDRSFVAELGSSAGGQQTAVVVVDLARSMGLRCVAEGVEEPAQLQELLAAGCDDAQGFLIARPLPAEGTEELLRSAAGRRAAA